VGICKVLGQETRLGTHHPVKKTKKNEEDPRNPKAAGVKGGVAVSGEGVWRFQRPRGRGTGKSKPNDGRNDSTGILQTNCQQLSEEVKRNQRRKKKSLNKTKESGWCGWPGPKKKH